MKRTILVLTLTLLLSSTATVRASSQGVPTGNFWANSTTPSSAPQAVGNVGGSQAHLNMQAFIISFVALLY